MNFGKETEYIEFKKSTSELKEGIISLTSMLNKNSTGKLYFGIKNNGDLIGQKIGDRTLRDISQSIANHIKPQVIPTINLQFINNMNIIEVEVNGNDVPYSAYGKYYIRSADEDRELNPNQLKELMRKQVNSDSIINIEANRQNLEFNQLKNLFLIRKININDKEFASNLGLYTKNKKYNLMAELLADENDISIKVVVFKGKDKTQIIRRNEYGFKCLITAMDQVLNYVESLNDTEVTLTSHQRIENDLFDFACFKEALQNAFIHTKWDRLNPPAVYIFSDRIEIISTGGLPIDLSEDEFYRGISRPVNEKLQKIFGQLGYVEQTGHGVPMIINKYGRNTIEVMDNFINVIIPFNRMMLNNYNEEIYNKRNLNDSQDKILKYLEKNPSMTIELLEKESGFSNSYIRKILKFLKNNKVITRVGSNKTGYWKIEKNIN